MGTADYYKRGEWNFYCDLCGRKRKSSDGEKSWNNLWVCRDHKERRNPQDFVRGVKDDQSVPWSRPEAPDQFVALQWQRTLLESLQLSEALSVLHEQWVPGGQFPLPTATINSFLLNGEPSTYGWSVPSASETLALTDSARGLVGGQPLDTSTLSESVSFSFVSLSQVNGSTLNSGVLNG